MPLQCSAQEVVFQFIKWEFLELKGRVVCGNRFVLFIPPNFKPLMEFYSTLLQWKIEHMLHKIAVFSV